VALNSLAQRMSGQDIVPRFGATDLKIKHMGCLVPEISQSVKNL
jgi:hypothetical protein